MPSLETNSVIISPHPPNCLMKRRNTVSVMPAIGARICAGRMETWRILSSSKTIGIRVRLRGADCVLTPKSQPLLFRDSKTHRAFGNQLLAAINRAAQFAEVFAQLQSLSFGLHSVARLRKGVHLG